MSAAEALMAARAAGIQLWVDGDDLVLEAAGPPPPAVIDLLGLIACSKCGCSVIGEIKKQRYVYYHCTGYAEKCQGNPATCRRKVCPGGGPGAAVQPSAWAVAFRRRRFSFWVQRSPSRQSRR